MRTTALAFLMLPGLALAQVQIQVDVPAVLPQLVVVQPGIRVVPDIEEEIFFVDGFYWVRRDGGWYHSRNYRGGWAFAQPRFVPPGLARIPPGQYRKWHPGPGWRPGPAPAAYRPGPGPGPYRPGPGPGPYRPGPGPGPYRPGPGAGPYRPGPAPGAYRPAPGPGRVVGPAPGGRHDEGRGGHGHDEGHERHGR